MKIVDFKGSNVKYAKDQDEYNVLPAFRDVDSYGTPVTSCWRLTRWERIKMLFTGRVYFTLMTFGAPLQPQYADTKFHNPQDPKG